MIELHLHGVSADPEAGGWCAFGWVAKEDDLIIKKARGCVGGGKFASRFDSELYGAINALAWAQRYAGDGVELRSEMGDLINVLSSPSVPDDDYTYGKSRLRAMVKAMNVKCSWGGISPEAKDESAAALLEATTATPSIKRWTPPKS